MNIHLYLKLMRFDKPVGIFLLWFPTVWALWIANEGRPPYRLMIIFLLGTIIMRAAGCVVNDMADIDFDKHVARTSGRPLTSGHLNLKQAFFLLGLLLSLALSLLLMLPWACVYFALAALVITFIYPFCKRFIQAPQMVLGFAFSMGMPMAYVASGKAFSSDLGVLLILNVLWVISYDTMYAMADREDDLQIGIKSTAILFAQFDRLILAVLQSCVHALWLLWAYMNHLSPAFFVIWGLSGGILIFQQQLIHHRNPQDCFKAFKMNVYYGGFMCLALILGL